MRQILTERQQKIKDGLETPTRQPKAAPKPPRTLQQQLAIKCFGY